MTKNTAATAPASSIYSTSIPTTFHTRTVNRRQRFAVAVTFIALTFGSVATAFAQAPVTKAPTKAPGAPSLPSGVQPRPPIRIPQPVAPVRTAPPPAALPPVPGQTEARTPIAIPQAPSVEEKAMRGVVIVERAGQPISLGTALSGDGRVLTALSPLGSGNDIDVRFADGTVVRAKLGHHDRMWDLALLVPQTGRWADGLIASTKDPVRAEAVIRSYSATRGKLAAAPMVIRGRRTLLGADDVSLPNAFELGSRVSPIDLGSPIIDEDGRVVSLLVRGCSPNEGKPCTPVAFGVPINAIRTFLKTVPATAVAPSAWLGIQGIADAGPIVKGVRVQSVYPDSPAAEAKLAAGDASVSDVIVAVDGVPVTTPDGLSETIRAQPVGAKVPLLLFGQGKYRQVTVVLRQAPDPRALPEQPVQADLPSLGDSAPPGAPRPKTDLMERRR
ncbi:MAG TPA: S1C family serine protease [Polyangium sp.]|nr:S1C family serine protease [Polyangium sp.]